MANTLADIIAACRLELDDFASPPRWSDQQYLGVIGRAMRRLQAILHRNDIEFGRAVYSFDTAPGLDTYYLPGDFLTDAGLFCTDTKLQLAKQSEARWETIVAAAEATVFILRGDQIILAGTPQSQFTMHLVYWPMLDTLSLADTTPTPWGGRLDDLIFQYTTIRFRNIDEEDASFDTELMQDMENTLLEMFSTITPVQTSLRAWLPHGRG
jgi:hypothetical protein